MRIRKFKDLTKSEYGQWTVIGLAEKRLCNLITWRCKCSCGTEKDVIGSSLVRGFSKSCGCTAHEGKKTGCGEITGTYWSRCRNRASRDLLEFTITIEEAWDTFIIQNRLCAVSGVPISFTKSYYKVSVERGKRPGARKGGVGGKIIQTASLDRINPHKGYVSGNIQWVHRTINYMKHTLPQTEFLDWCKRVANHQAALRDKDPTQR